jgi:fructosamine-3-kinase
MYLSDNFGSTKVAKGPNAPMMCEGEFESLNAMNQALSSIAPKALAWGKYKNEDTYFMMAEFREIGQQPPDPIKFTSRLAKMHEVSVSPTGRFGFHTTTCHGFIPQATNMWEDSWAVLYQKQLAHMLAIDLEKNGPWAEFEQLSDLTLKKVIPRLLNPLQSEGRSIKPCLLHGDCWDENTATDMENGEPCVFDAGSFYGHNEYDIGNWRAPRHRLSSKVYVRNYKRHFAVSEPGKLFIPRLDETEYQIPMA